MTWVNTYPRFKAWDWNANPLVGGKIYSYVVGTSTQVPTYADADCVVPNTNPVVLDSLGEANLFISGTVKLVIYDSEGNHQFTINEAAGSILWTFSPQTAGVLYSSTVYGGTQAILQAAITAVGGSEATLYLAPANWLITSNLTIPANITLKPERGAMLSMTTGVVTQINGGFDCGDWQCFSSPDSTPVKFGTTALRKAVPQVNPLWFGATGDGVTDDSLAFTQAFNTSPAVINPGGIGTNGVTVIVPLGKYVLNDVTITQNSSLIGRGPTSQAQIIKGSTATKGAICCEAVAGEGGNGTIIKNLAILSSATVPYTYGIYVNSFQSLYMENVWTNGGRALYLDNCGDTRITNCTFDGGDVPISTGPGGVDALRIVGCWTRCTSGMQFNSLNNAVIESSIFVESGIQTSGNSQFIKLVPDSTGLCRNITIANNQFYAYPAGTVPDDYPYSGQFAVSSVAIFVSTGCKDIAIDSNQFFGWIQKSIYVIDSEAVQIKNNMIRVSDDGVYEYPHIPSTINKIAISYGIQITETGSGACKKIDIADNDINITLSDATLTFNNAVYCKAVDSRVSRNMVEVYWNYNAARSLSTLIFLAESNTIANDNQVIANCSNAAPNNLTFDFGIKVDSGATGCSLKRNRFVTYGGAVITYPRAFLSDGNYGDMGDYAATASMSSADHTVWPIVNAKTLLFNGANFAADHTLTLGTAYAFDGAEMDIVRSAGDTGGPWSLILNSSPSVNIPTKGWCKIKWAVGPIPPTVALNAASGLVTDGVHRVRIVSVTAGGEYGVSGASAAVTVASNKKIDVTGIPAISGDITGYAIYMTTAASPAGIYYYVDTTTSTSYTINVADVSLVTPLATSNWKLTAYGLLP